MASYKGIAVCGLDAAAAALVSFFQDLKRLGLTGALITRWFGDDWWICWLVLFSRPQGAAPDDGRCMEVWKCMMHMHELLGDPLLLNSVWDGGECFGMGLRLNDFWTPEGETGRRECQFGGGGGG